MELNGPIIFTVGKVLATLWQSDFIGALWRSFGVVTLRILVPLRLWSFQQLRPPLRISGVILEAWGWRVFG